MELFDFVNNIAGVLGNTNLPHVELTAANIQKIAQFMFKLAAGLALVYILIGAVKLGSSGGDSQKVAEGKKTISYAVVGLIIAVSAYIIIAFVQKKAAEVAGSGDPFFGGGGIITGLVDTISWVVGVVSVIMVVAGGLKFVTSGGNQQSVQSAKSTVIYALIGLVVAILAKTLVTFVLSKL